VRWPAMKARLATALGLVLVAQATETAEWTAQWWTPAAEFAKVYDLTSADQISAPRSAALLTRGHAAEAPSQVRPLLLQESTLNLLGLGAAHGRENGTTHKAGAKSGTAAAAHATAVKVNATTVNGGNAAADSAKVEAKKQVPEIVKKSWPEMLRATLSFAFIIKALCMASNLAFQVSPLPAVKEWPMKGNTGEADSAPYISIAYGSCQWCFYGLFAFIVTAKQGFLVLVYSNMCGTVLGIYYVYAFSKHCKDEEVWLRSKVYCQVLSVVAASQIVAMLAMPVLKALFFSGLISSAWSVVGAMSLLTTVPTVLRTRSSKTLPQPLLVVGGVSAILWITCGVMLKDPWITVPNVWSFCCTCFALGLCWIYPGEPCCCEEEQEDTEEAAPLMRRKGSCESGGWSKPAAECGSPRAGRSWQNLTTMFRGGETDGGASSTTYGTEAGSRLYSRGHGASAGTGETWG
jgi:solute carrier family 50 protein (sugar transporter)